MPKLKVVMPDDEPDNAGEPRVVEIDLAHLSAFAFELQMDRRTANFGVRAKCQ